MTHSHDSAQNFVLSIIAPVYNEESVLESFHARLAAVLEGIQGSAEVLYINDGSTDGSLEVLRRLRSRDSRASVLDLSRNFGKEIAISAGLDFATGDAAIVIDSDLQDPPELIPALLVKWREGHDVVYARREERSGESLLKIGTAYWFYRVLNRLCDIPIPSDTGDYRLLSRRAVRALCRFREQHRFMKGLFAWIGFSQVAVPYQREARHSGSSKFNYWKLWNFALEGITSFSVGPLKVATYLGLAIALYSFLFAAWIVLKTLLFGDPVQGYPTMMTMILLLGGMQLTAIGLLGEYVGRIFNETKGRPLYLVNSFASGGETPGRFRAERARQALDFGADIPCLPRCTADMEPEPGSFAELEHKS